MIFKSDNWAGAAPEIIDAVAKASDGLAPAYGDDPLSRAVEERFCEIFERDVAVYLVATGGAANGLALSVLASPYAMILCHEESHIQMDECGGPEFFTGGAKLLPLKGFAAKIAPETVIETLRRFPERAPHGTPPKVLSITQASECGAVYKPEELKALCGAAHEKGLFVHVDGARFSNAVASLGASPAELTWKAGVDALSFGGTKNGCIAAEAIVFFDKALAADVELRRKRAGHLWSKQRFIAAQFDAYLKDGLWLRLAARANAMAKRLAGGIAAIDGAKVWYPVEANEVFASFPGKVAARLVKDGANINSWVTPGDPADGRLNRFVCAFSTREDDVDRFLEHLKTAIS
jgi:threonine aldolase